MAPKPTSLEVWETIRSSCSVPVVVVANAVWRHRCITSSRPGGGSRHEGSEIGGGVVVSPAFESEGSEGWGGGNRGSFDAAVIN